MYTQILDDRRVDCRQSTAGFMSENGNCRGGDESPAKVEHLEGDQPARITLTDDAVKRIDLRTAPVAEVDERGAKQRRCYAALLYTTRRVTRGFIRIRSH